MLANGIDERLVGTKFGYEGAIGRDKRLKTVPERRLILIDATDLSFHCHSPG